VGEHAGASAQGVGWRARLATPRLDQGRILADVPLEHLVPAMSAQHRAAIGLDRVKRGCLPAAYCASKSMTANR